MSKKNILGNRIKEWRKLKKLTQEDLAGLVNRSTEAISMIERGINNPAPETIQAISDVLKIPIHEFYKTEIDNNKRQQIIDRIIGMLYGVDQRKLEAIEKQIEIICEI